MTPTFAERLRELEEGFQHLVDGVIDLARDAVAENRELRARLDEARLAHTPPASSPAPVTTIAQREADPPMIQPPPDGENRCYNRCLVCGEHFWARSLDAMRCVGCRYLGRRPTIDSAVPMVGLTNTPEHS